MDRQDAARLRRADGGGLARRRRADRCARCATWQRRSEHRARDRRARALRDALRRQFPPDIILSDFSMPGFSGQEALRIAQRARARHAVPLRLRHHRRGARDRSAEARRRRLRAEGQPAAPAVGDGSRVRARPSERARAHAHFSGAARERRTLPQHRRDRASDWIWEIDTDGTIVYSNEAVRDILGYTAQEVLGRNMLALMAPTTRAAVEALIPQYLVGSGRWRRRSMTLPASRRQRTHADQQRALRARRRHDSAGLPRHAPRRSPQRLAQDRQDPQARAHPLGAQRLRRAGAARDRPAPDPGPRLRDRRRSGRVPRGLHRGASGRRSTCASSRAAARPKRLRRSAHDNPIPAGEGRRPARRLSGRARDARRPHGRRCRT